MIHNNFYRSTMLLISVILTLSFSPLGHASGDNNEETPDKPVLVNLQYLPTQNLLAVSFKNHPKWHTYWKNPGDSGLPLRNEFFLQENEVKLEELSWPIPKKYIEEGGIIAYGFEGEYTLFYRLNENHQSLLANKELTLKSRWLVCKHICIPGKKDVTTQFSQNGLSGHQNDFQIEKETLLQRMRDLPKMVKAPSYLDIVLSKNHKKEGLVLFYNLTTLKKNNFLKDINLLTPYPQQPFDFRKEETFKDKQGNSYFKMMVDWDGEYLEPPLKLPLDGVFKTPYTLRFLYANPDNQKVEIIQKTFTRFNLESSKQLDTFFSTLKKNDQKNTSTGAELKNVAGENIPAPTAPPGIFHFLLLAILGGFILNFMPCVLPVISIKLFGLIQYRDSSRMEVLKHNLFYSLGILSSFLVLALAIIGIKSTGQVIGWGFHLQSPKFVATMIVLLFVLALNLFGLFEFVTPGGKKLGDIESKNGVWGDFLSGVLATILSTPCSAPFLGAALTFAFTSSNMVSIIIFLGVGVGLALPFLLTGIFPQLVGLLPKPGHWMEHLKKFLALSLILTTIWLMDVFSSQISHTLPMIKLNTSLAFLFFFFYMRSKITKKWIYTSIFLLFSLGMIFSIFSTKIEIDKNTNLLTQKNTSEVNWQAFSPELVSKYRTEKKLTFIDFTAKWCFTCKVNEKLVIDRQSFQDLIKESNAQLILGDWTNHDPVIGNWLKEQGLVGVPAYFVINSQGTLVPLGETITLQEIKNALQ
jgi:thiol:disulfide interchange protein/DsbC/DsbD-like thiol-disulfide interchange protein